MFQEEILACSTTAYISSSIQRTVKMCALSIKYGILFNISCIFRFSNCWVQLQGNGNAAQDGPSTSAGADSEALDDIDDDDDELDLDELNELEASLAKTSIQIKETGAEA